MAVQQNKKSRSRRDMRRAHDFIKHGPALSEDPASGELHLRHHVTKEGFYRGKQVIFAKKAAILEDEE